MEYRFSELIEQLIIANIKLTIFDHLKKIEVNKAQPDSAKVVEWEKAAKIANERRAECRNAIDLKLSEIITNNKYDPRLEVRTFPAVTEEIEKVITEGLISYNTEEELFH